MAGRPSRKIVQKDEDGEMVDMFYSVTEAIEASNVSKATFHKKLKSGDMIDKYYYSYLDDELIVE